MCSLGEFAFTEHMRASDHDALSVNQSFIVESGATFLDVENGTADVWESEHL